MHTRNLDCPAEGLLHERHRRVRCVLLVLLLALDQVVSPNGEPVHCIGVPLEQDFAAELLVQLRFELGVSLTPAAFAPKQACSKLTSLPWSSGSRASLVPASHTTGVDLIPSRSAAVTNDGWFATATSTFTGESSLASNSAWSQPPTLAPQHSTHVSPPETVAHTRDLPTASQPYVTAQTHVDGSALTAMTNFSMIGRITRMSEMTRGPTYPPRGA